VSRRLENFVEAFCLYSEVYNTTPLYARASALWMVGTAVRRSVAMRSRGNNLSPNLFIELVGGPGTGKSQSINAVRSVFIPATNRSIIPASVTRAGMEDYMKENLQQGKTPDGGLLMSHECIGLSEEMQGILPDQDLGHLTLYNILYDLPSIHKAVTRSYGEIRLEAPYCSILTGAQPAFLATTMPEQAWGMGFMSRSIMVFDTPRERRSMFELRDVDHKLKADLIHDLKLICDLFGYMEWEDEAVGLYDEWWVEAGGQPVPSQKRLAMGYNSRRELHMAKLAMIHSLARSNDLFVSVKDVASAIKDLLHFEAQMKNIFIEMATTGSMVALADVLDRVKVNSAEGKKTDEATLIEMLMQRFPSTQVHSMIENMISSRAIVSCGGVEIKGMRKFTVGASMGFG
jgi:hypothetical protein